MPNDNTKYTFNGTEYGKGRLVLAVISRYVLDKSPSYKELINSFPATLQGSLGVVISKESLDDRNENSNDIIKRYFAGDVDALVTSDNVKIFVCSQWGTGNISEFISKATELGYDINAVGDMAQTIKELYEEYKNSPRGDWTPDYRDRCKQLSLFKDKPFNDYDTPLLKLIWEKTSNGVANVRPGFLSKQEFESLLDELPFITSKIVQNPSPETLDEVILWAKKAKTNGKFRLETFARKSKAKSGML